MCRVQVQDDRVGTGDVKGDELSHEMWDMDWRHVPSRHMSRAEQEERNTSEMASKSFARASRPSGAPHLVPIVSPSLPFRPPNTLGSNYIKHHLLSTTCSFLTCVIVHSFHYCLFLNPGHNSRCKTNVIVPELVCWNSLFYPQCFFAPWLLHVSHSTLS